MRARPALWFPVSALFAVAVTALVVLQPPQLVRDAPRDLPWTLPDYRLANTHWEIGDDGRIYTQVEHLFLPDITPAMLSWFYQQLPIATVDFRGKTYPLYHIFHPTEHGSLRVLEPAIDGSAGMGVGALIQRDEWFGPYDSRGAARIDEFSESGMLAIPRAAGTSIGRVRHTFRAAPGGSYYRVDSIIGSELPLLGPLINLYLRERIFHPDMLQEWRRHQVEEVASLRFFLPGLYAQRHMGRHFKLTETPTPGPDP